jgi:hypothetical protein
MNATDALSAVYKAYESLMSIVNLLPAHPNFVQATTHIQTGVMWLEKGIQLANFAEGIVTSLEGDVKSVTGEVKTLEGELLPADASATPSSPIAEPLPTPES